MEPTLDSIAVSSLKNNLKKIGDLTVNLCGSSSPNPDVRTKAQKINKLAHEMYELLIMEENSRKSRLNMSCFNEAGIKRT